MHTAYMFESDFYRAACNATHGIAVAILSVCPSFRCVFTNTIIRSLYMKCAFALYVTATFIALRSIVLVEILGIQKLTNAFGLTVLFQGIAVLFGSPISGFSACL